MANGKDTLRADMALVAQGLAPSREKAQAHIMAGLVYQGEKRIDKASEAVPAAAELILRGHVHPYVSRGGLKLEKALEAFSADVTETVAMDIGAATGGFTDVLLRGGAAHVYAIDVGYGQFDWKLRNDPRVTVMERTNARHMTEDQFPLKPNVTVMDVSFISIKLILPVAAAIMGRGGRFYTLIKPQFEAGRDKIGKKGVVRDPAVHQAVIESIAQFAAGMDWAMTNLTFSPITGPEGNIEFLAEIRPMEQNTVPVSLENIGEVVASAHGDLR